MSVEQANNWDAIVIGGGAAGLFCAGVAGQLGQKVLVLDHADVLGEKIRISGGGRCNFTNVNSSPANFLSMNPNFVKSALSRYKASSFIDLVKSYNIPFHEKHKGQLFCDHSAEDIIRMLLAECAAGGVDIRTGCSVKTIQAPTETSTLYTLETSHGLMHTASLVVATGGGVVTRPENWGQLHQGVVIWLDAPDALLLHLDNELRAAAQLIMQDVIDDFAPHIDAEIKRRMDARMERLLSQYQN